MRRLLAAPLCAVLWPAVSLATDVEVHVHGMDARGGSARAFVCTEAEFLHDCAIQGVAPARAGETVVLVHNVPPGDYSVFAFHDVHDTGDVVRDFLGIPKEGVGFSQNPMLMFGPPRFRDTEVRAHGPLVRVDITLKFEP